MNPIKTILFMITSVYFSMVAFAEIIPLKEIINPTDIAVGYNKICIADKEYVYIYSLTDLSLIKKVGGKGEGPGMFKIVPGLELKIFFSQKSILIDSPTKISYFSLDGVLLKEVKKQNASLPYFPLGEKFIKSTTISNYAHFYFVEENSGVLNEKQLFFKTYCPPQIQAGIFKFDPTYLLPIHFYCLENLIIIQELNGTIQIFNSEGKQLYTIMPSFGRLKVTDQLKEEVLTYYHNHPATRNVFNTYKQYMEFPEFFQLVRNLIAVDGKIFVTPYEKMEGKNLFYIFSITGQFLKKIIAPLREENILRLYPYTIANNKVFQIVESEDEFWELHIETLNEI